MGSLRSSFYGFYTLVHFIKSLVDIAKSLVDIAKSLVHIIKSLIVTLLILDDSLVIATHLTKLFKNGLVPLAVILFSLLLISRRLFVHVNHSYHRQTES